MEQVLQTLLNRLERIGDEHEELFDSEVRERMGNAVLEAFVRARTDDILPVEFGMLSGAANRKVHAAIEEYVTQANRTAQRLRLSHFHDRLAAFQNGGVRSAVEGSYYDDFFGYVNPESFDEQGNAV